MADTKQKFGNLYSYVGPSISVAQTKAAKGNLVFAEITDGKSPASDVKYYIYANGASWEFNSYDEFSKLKTLVGSTGSFVSGSTSVTVIDYINERIEYIKSGYATKDEALKDVSGFSAASLSSAVGSFDEGVQFTSVLTDATGNTSTGPSFNIVTKGDVTVTLNTASDADGRTAVISYTHPTSAAAGTWGGDVANDTLYYPVVTVDSKGHVTGASTIDYAVPVLGADGYLQLDANKKVIIGSTSLVAGGGTYAVETNLAEQGYVDEKVAEAIKGGVQYKGTTAITTQAEMTALSNAAANGDMYKLTANSAEGVSPSWKAGDVVIFKVSDAGVHSYDIIPSGDDIEYTGVKADGTTVIDATVGGDVNFISGDNIKLTIDSTNKSITVGTTGIYIENAESGFHTLHVGTSSYTHPTYAAVDPVFNKIGRDAHGHVVVGNTVAKGDITTLLGDYVESFGGQTGVITLSTAATGTTNSVRLEMEGNVLKATISNPAQFEAAFTDGSATGASVDDDSKIAIFNVGQSAGAIVTGTTAVVLAKVAKTGDAGDVNFTTAITGATEKAPLGDATVVDVALDNLSKAIAALKSSGHNTVTGDSAAFINVTGDTDGDHTKYTVGATLATPTSLAGITDAVAATATGLATDAYVKDEIAYELAWTELA